MSRRARIPRWEDVLTPRPTRPQAGDADNGAAQAPDRPATQEARVRSAPTTETAEAGAPRPAEDGRPQLRGVHVGRDQFVARVEVTLRRDGREARTIEEASATTGGIQRAVAAATLRGVQSLQPAGERYEVESVARLTGHSGDLVVVEVSCLGQVGMASVAGVARVTSADPERATARAALDAVNRRVST